MTIVFKFILILLIATIVIPGASHDSLAAISDRTQSVSAAGTRPFTPGALLDDFSYGAPLNLWNASTGTFSKSAVVPTPTDESCDASYTTDTGTENGRPTGNCLKLEYNVSRPYDPVTKYSTYSGYYSNLMPDPDNPATAASVTAYNAISFYVKGAAGGEFFKIQIRNNSGDNSYFAPESYAGAGDATHYSRNASYLYITDYLDGGVTTGWKKVTIPFHNFANLDGWASMKDFVIVFENSQIVANSSQAQGTIYIDNITFENITIPAVRVDPFGDKLDICALGGVINKGVGPGTAPNLNYPTYSSGPNQSYPEGIPYGMRIDYNVLVGYAYTYLIFGGGNTNVSTPEHPIASEAPDRGGWIAISQDFSAYTKLTFRVRAQSVNENPKTMKIEFVDGGGTKPFVIAAISDAWQLYTIPLSSVPLLNKTTIKQLTFVLEDWRINSAGGNKSGVIFIDSVQFE